MTKGLRLLEKYGLLGLFALMFIGFSINSSDKFPKVSNLQVVGANKSVLAIGAIAAIVPLIAGNFDLSIGQNLCFASIAAAAAVTRFHLPHLVAMVIGVLAAAVVGLVNGLLVTRVGLSAIIATLGSTIVLRGLITWYTTGQTISMTGGLINDLGQGTVGPIPKPLFWVVIIAIALWFVLTQTPFGRYLQSVGANPASARLVGLNVNRLTLQSFVVSGALAGVAGVLQTARNPGGNPNIGPGYLFPILAAVFLGATAFRPGRFNVPGTVLAIAFVGFAVQGLTFAGVDAWVEDVFNGGALLLAATIGALVRRRQRA